LERVRVEEDDLLENFGLDELSAEMMRAEVTVGSASVFISHYSLFPRLHLPGSEGKIKVVEHGSLLY